MAKFPSIPPAQPDLASLQRTVEAMRQVVEILAGLRGDGQDRAVLVNEITALQARIAKLEA
jgi:hypothetical protein